MKTSPSPPRRWRGDTFDWQPIAHILHRLMLKPGFDNVVSRPTEYESFWSGNLPNKLLQMFFNRHDIVAPVNIATNSNLAMSSRCASFPPISFHEVMMNRYGHLLRLTKPSCLGHRHSLKGIAPESWFRRQQIRFDTYLNYFCHNVSSLPGMP